jgi:hypothetical protein
VPEGLVREPAGHAVSHDAFLTAAPTPRIGVENSTLDHRPPRSQVLSHRDEAKLIQTAKRGQIGCSKGSVGHVEVFRMGCVRTSILEDLDTQLKANARDRPTLSSAKSRQTLGFHTPREVFEKLLLNSEVASTN